MLVLEEGEEEDDQQVKILKKEQKTNVERRSCERGREDNRYVTEIKKNGRGEGREKMIRAEKECGAVGEERGS